MLGNMKNKKNHLMNVQIWVTLIIESLCLFIAVRIITFSLFTYMLNSKVQDNQYFWFCPLVPKLKDHKDFQFLKTQQC